MHLIRVGRRVISLEHLILAEFSDGSNDPNGPPPGGARVTLESGKEFDFGPSETDLFSRYLAEVVRPDPAEASEQRSGSVGVVIDPLTGHPVPRANQGGAGG